MIFNVFRQESEKHHSYVLFSSFFLLLVVCIVSLGSVAGSQAAEITVAWDPNTEATLAGYKLYYGTASRTYTSVIPIDKTTTSATVGGLQEGTTYYFAATAYDTTGNESDFSSELVSYGILAASNENGTITQSSLVEQGGSQTFYITPDTGYHILDVLVDGFSKGAVSSYTFKDVATNHTISAVFEKDNLQPIADAGSNQTVNEGDPVGLSGSNSFDPDGSIVSYQWIQTAGASVELSNPTSPTPTFTSPNIGLGGDALYFKLTVTDDGGSQAESTCMVNVTWVNEPPKADAGQDQTVYQGTLTTLLDCSASTDPDDGIYSYSWKQISGSDVALLNPTTIKPTVDLGSISSDGESLVFQVTATDFHGLQSTDSITVNAIWANLPPVAEAGPDITVNEGGTVTLNGCASKDPENGIKSYHWKHTDGSPVTLADPTAAVTTFEAPQVDSSGAILNFSLTVIDNAGLESTDNCQVVVNDSPSIDLTGSWQNLSINKNWITGTFAAQNIGDLDSGPVSVAYNIVSKDGPSFYKFPETILLSNLSAGQSINLQVKFKWKDTFRGQFIVATIASRDVSDKEINQENNEVWMMIQ